MIKNKENKTVVVGMSGGVDSSVAAYLLKEEGYNVIGVTMVVIPDYACNGRKRTESIVEDAKKVAKDLDIEHYVLDLRERFQKEVIDNFSSEYLSGRTPNPCIVCNRQIKFGDLFEYAIDELNADYVVTGHYANIIKDENGRYLMKKARDKNKDQTYFLYGIDKKYLKNIIMPLEKYDKEEVRKIAEKINLNIAEKPDSEEICFIPDDNHGKFIIEDLGKKVIPGDFVDINGNVLGRHKGIIYYTIGQRKGLGISLGERTYVQDIIYEKNQVVLGKEEGIFKTKLYANQVNLLSMDKLPDELYVNAKIRYAAKEARAKVTPYNEGMIVEFDTPQRAITKGQSVVLYDGDVVVGGGVVDKIY